MEQELIRRISDGVDSAKAGKALEAYSSFCRYLSEGTMPQKSHYPFGWIIYYALHQTDSKDIASRKQMLANYLKLSVAKPHKLHSMILTEANRLYKEAIEADEARRFGDSKSPFVQFSMLRFIKLWDIRNLRHGDWKRKEHDGKLMGSTVERLITCLCDEAVRDKALPSPEIIDLLDRAVVEYPDSASIKAQRAAIHQLAGEEEQAVNLLRDAILFAPTKFYLWSRLAEMIDRTTAPRLKIALFYKALCCPGQEAMKGRIHLSLAESLCGVKAWPQALFELKTVERLYNANGWHLPRLHSLLSEQIPAGTTPENPEQIYRRIARMAEEFVYDRLPDVAVTKTYHKEPRPGEESKFPGQKPATAWRLTDKDGNNYWIQPHRHGLDPALAIGTAFIAKIHGGKAVKVTHNTEA